jgi:hypothetical protein
MKSSMTGIASASSAGDHLRLIARGGHAWTRRFPWISAIGGKLYSHRADRYWPKQTVLDGTWVPPKVQQAL